jgi:hypothetical protein
MRCESEELYLHMHHAVKSPIVKYMNKVVRSPTEAEVFLSSSFCIQTGPGAHPASCRVGTGGPFARGKIRPGRDSDHSPPSSAEIKKQ